MGTLSFSYGQALETNANALNDRVFVYVRTVDHLLDAQKFEISYSLLELAFNGDDELALTETLEGRLSTIYEIQSLLSDYDFEKQQIFFDEIANSQSYIVVGVVFIMIGSLMFVSNIILEKDK